MAQRRISVLLSVCLVGWLGLGCEEPAADPTPQPDLLLISIDTLRADHLGAYGYPRATSPHIDALATRGVVFDNTMSTSSWTLPVHASLLTGLYPSQHQIRDDGVRLPSRIPTLAGALRDAGYHTFAVVSQVYVSRAFGFERGFAHFDDELIQGGKTNPIAELVVDRFFEALDSADERPFFAFVHFFDPHWPYTPPGEFAHRFVDPDYPGPIDGSMSSLAPWFDSNLTLDPVDREQMIALYDAEIAYLDDQLGRLFEGLRERGRLEDTVVVLTADHGEEFREHQQLGHGRTLYEEQLRVPLIIAGAGAFPPGEHRSDLASTIDVAPTLLELAGAEPLEHSVGRSLLRPAEHAPIRHAESIRFGLEIRAVRQGHHKVIEMPANKRRRYFDLDRDPGEKRALAADPTAGVLSRAIAHQSALAERGWHVKLLAFHGEPLRAEGVLTTSGRFVHVRLYASQNIGGAVAQTLRFGVDRQDAGRLQFDVLVDNHTAEFVFETEPADAAVTFEIHLKDRSSRSGLFVGAGERLPDQGPVTLKRRDPRLAGRVHSYATAHPGVYVRAVAAPGDLPRSELSSEVRQHLEALGYTDESGNRSLRGVGLVPKGPGEG